MLAPQGERPKNDNERRAWFVLIEVKSVARCKVSGLNLHINVRLDTSRELHEDWAVPVVPWIPQRNFRESFILKRQR